MTPFNWPNVIERAAWTGIQVPAVQAIMDATQGRSVLDRDLIVAAALGFAVSALKTVGQERLAHLSRTGR